MPLKVQQISHKIDKQKIFTEQVFCRIDASCVQKKCFLLISLRSLKMTEILSEIAYGFIRKKQLESGINRSIFAQCELLRQCIFFLYKHGRRNLHIAVNKYYIDHLDGLQRCGKGKPDCKKGTFFIGMPLTLTAYETADFRQKNSMERDQEKSPNLWVLHKKDHFYVVFKFLLPCIMLLLISN